LQVRRCRASQGKPRKTRRFSRRRIAREKVSDDAVGGASGIRNRSTSKLGKRRVLRSGPMDERVIKCSWRSVCSRHGRWCDAAMRRSSARRPSGALAMIGGKRLFPKTSDPPRVNSPRVWNAGAHLLRSDRSLPHFAEHGRPALASRKVANGRCATKCPASEVASARRSTRWVMARAYREWASSGCDPSPTLDDDARGDPASP
jgi:hypothetical protein